MTPRALPAEIEARPQQFGCARDASGGWRGFWKQPKASESRFARAWRVAAKKIFVHISAKSNCGMFSRFEQD